jgi:probable phosphoglycerate mutase
VTEGPGRIVVLRHGETTWSRAGRHTGLTDLPLTAHGEDLARSLTGHLAAYDIGLCLASPLQRAWRTAELAGLQPVAEPALEERHYGPVEGRTTAEVRSITGDPGWDVWDSDLGSLQGVHPPVDAFVGPPESTADVGARIEPVLGRCRDVMAGGRDCVLVAHSHLLRILAACWLRLPPDDGRHLVLDAARLGVLGYERSTPALLGWNLTG